MAEENYLKGGFEAKQIEKHFNDMWEEQYDFHYYCLRNWKLRIYTKFIRFQDSLFKSKVFEQSQLVLIKIFLELLEQPQKKDQLIKAEKDKEVIKNFESKDFIEECARRIRNLI